MEEQRESSSDFVRLTRTIADLERALSPKSITAVALQAHVARIRSAIEMVEMVTGSDSPFSAQLRSSKLAKDVRRLELDLRYSPRQFDKRLMPVYTRGDFERTFRSVMTEQTSYLLKFLRRVVKRVAPALVRNTSAIADAQVLIQFSRKATFLKAAGLIACNHIATRLRFELKKSDRGDDILDLYQVLKGKTRNHKIGNFLKKSYRRFENARDTRNRCAHVDREDPTESEVRAVIELGGELPF